MNEFPLPWSDPRVRSLRDTVASALFRHDDVVDVARAAGIEPSELNLNQPARRLWTDLFDHAAGKQALPRLLTLATDRVPALQVRIDELLSEVPLVEAPEPEEPAWKGFTPDGRERQIVEGQDTLLDVVFLEQGVHCARAVCRLSVAIGRDFFHGTGFRIGERTLLTNHHVLHDWTTGQRATWVRAEFGFEIDITGQVRQPSLVDCDITSIQGSRADDFAIITTNDPIPSDAPILPLTTGATVNADDRVYIVQHPQGLPKKIAMLHNLVRHADAQVVQYWTDTEQGSSGSPVFDEQWRVVALHHKSVEIAQGTQTEFRNQGRAIARIADRIAELGTEIRDQMD
ncbi:V8-like Glu-specific endopeptidase [Kibdelosporangium banguiense]|uniref:Serine protease n=1 Tax=Kibdelosporangium banguiense TaxID=1365924 RepID=A0ABS4U1R1_9PSEU|nr:trypsin-like peptidase domain-containing protein [Kibdelosporangium banguiense]MBP2330140.1 V8-like Glu-specific endopeptidase [Kibdelosporangium banguiense]